MVLKIYIVGAGLGGISAAIACAVSGHRVTVLERAPELAEIGAGLQLGPNATSILYEYDLGPGLEDCWVEPLQMAEMARMSIAIWKSVGKESF